MKLRVVAEGESKLFPGANIYWIGRVGEDEPFGQIIATPEHADELLRVANQGEGE